MLEGVERWDLALTAIFIAVAVDAAVDVANGGCTDDDGDDNIVDFGAGGKFLI